MQLNISFVCLGNICRSPMAEAVFTNIAHSQGVGHLFNVSSFATSAWEVGNPVYPPAARTLEQHGICGFVHHSQQLRLSDIAAAHYILVMDGMNYADVTNLAGSKYSQKVFRLGSFLTPPCDIADPYYTRDFGKAYSDIYRSCEAFIKYILQRHKDILK